MASTSINGTQLCALTTQFHRSLPSKYNTDVMTISPKPNLFFKRLKKPSASAVAAAEAIESSDSTRGEEPVEEKKLRVVVKGQEKPRLDLKFIWMEKNIGLALDQVIPGYGTVPLSPYYFWPRKDAWEELKSKLEEKPWISQKRIIILLNQATDIINLWQQSGGNIS